MHGANVKKVEFCSINNCLSLNITYLSLLFEIGVTKSLFGLFRCPSTLITFFVCLNTESTGGLS